MSDLSDEEGDLKKMVIVAEGDDKEDVPFAEQEEAPAQEEVHQLAKGRPRLQKVAGKKPAKPGRFIKSIAPIVQLVNPAKVLDEESRVALSRCLDVLADGIGEAFSTFRKPIPENDAGYEAQMLTAVLAFNAVFSRIPPQYHDECSETVQGILDRYYGVKSAEDAAAAEGQ